MSTNATHPAFWAVKVLWRQFAGGWAMLFLLATSAHSNLVVRSLAFEGKLPYVDSVDAAENRAASRINNALYLDLLSLAAPSRLQDGLKVRKRDGDSTSLADISFAVDRSDQRLLALSVSAQGCGAYCEPFTRSFVFDAVNGRRIRALDLFTAQGARAIAQSLARQRSTRLKNEVARLRNLANPETKSGKKLTDDERDRSREAADMFEACIPKYAEAGRSQEALESEEIKVTDASVVFVRGRCSIHATQALDDLGDFNNPLLFQDLLAHLNPYGRYLLAAAPANQAPASPLGQVLFGKIGNAPITVWLHMPYGSNQDMGGLYFYDRFRQPISIFGSLRGETWELAEEAPEGKPVPILRFKVNGDRLIGEWINPPRRLVFEATP